MHGPLVLDAAGYVSLNLLQPMRERVYVRPPKYSQDCWGPFSSGLADESDLQGDWKKAGVRAGQIEGRERNSKAQEKPAQKSRDKKVDDLQQTAIKVPDAQKLHPSFQVNIPWTPFSETKVERDLFERPYVTNAFSSAQSAKHAGPFADLSAIGHILPIHPETEPNESCDSLVREILGDDPQPLADPRKLLGNFLSHFADNLAIDQHSDYREQGGKDKEKTDKKKPVASSQKQRTEDTLKDRTMIAGRTNRSSQADPDCLPRKELPISLAKPEQTADPAAPDMHVAAPPQTAAPAPLDHPLASALEQPKRSKMREREVAEPLSQEPLQEAAPQIKRIDRQSKKASSRRAEAGQPPRVSQIAKYPAGPQLQFGLEVRSEKLGDQVVQQIRAKSRKQQRENAEAAEEGLDASADRKQMRRPTQAPRQLELPMKDLLVRICRQSVVRLNN